jgi:hypothetical protein
MRKIPIATGRKIPKYSRCESRPNIVQNKVASLLKDGSLIAVAIGS